MIFKNRGIFMKEFKGERSDFSERLRKARIARGYTQAQLAEIAGINVKTISRWEVYEKDISNPKESVNTLRASHVFKIAQALDVTPEYLIEGEDNMNIYMNQIEAELKALTIDEIRDFHKKPLTDKVLAHLKLTDDFIDKITDYWCKNTLKCRNDYVQNTIIRYCHNRPTK